MSIDVIGNINYLVSTTDECTAWFANYSLPMPINSNMIQASIPVTIHDLRDKEKSFDLDTNGFEVVKYNGSIQEEFDENTEAQKTYFEEISDLLKKRLGASHVVIYNYVFRSRNTPFSNEHCDKHHKNPVFHPHVDADESGVRGYVEKKCGKAVAEKAKKNRLQMINIWRLLGSNPSTDKPLTVCDYGSIDIDKDIQPLIIRRADQSVTAYTLSRNAQDTHMWYYLNNMKSDEMLVFKTFDSKPDVAQFVFHTAFKNDNMPMSNAEQKSLEIRCFVFYDE